MKSLKNGKKPKKALYMTRSTTILVTSVVCLAISSIACANSPSSLTVSYNLETQDLQVTITHPVSNPTTHYIYKVDLQKNGMPYNTSTYTNQPDQNSFMYTYQVNATTGDTIDVTASCIQGGSKTAHYTISTTGGEENTSTPGFELIIILGAFLVYVLLLRKKNNQS